jgi:hypothetical protein
MLLIDLINNLATPKIKHKKEVCLMSNKFKQGPKYLNLQKNSPCLTTIIGASAPLIIVMGPQPRGT